MKKPENGEKEEKMVKKKDGVNTTLVTLSHLNTIHQDAICYI